MGTKVVNGQNEVLEVLFEGADIHRASDVLVFIHGFGTNLHERGLFDDIVGSLTDNDKHLTTVRFSWSGFGGSEGEQEETTLQKVSGDFESVLDWVFANKTINARVAVLGFSMGNIIASNVLASGHYPVQKVVNVSPADFKPSSQSFQKWLSRPGAKLEGDILSMPRADGTVTRLNRRFWDTMGGLNYSEKLEKTVSLFPSTLIRATDDHVVDNSALKTINFSNIIELTGDHNFSGKKDRPEFLNELAELFTERNIIVDLDDNVIGCKVRSDINSDDIYRVSGLWVGNDKNQVLLAKRSKYKSQNPDRWMPVVVSGTVAEGETYEENIIKETMEEIGIDLRAKGFELIQKKLVNTKYNFYASVFKPILPIAKEEIKFDINETSELKWFDKGELKKQIEANPDDFVPEMSQVTDGLL